MPAKKQRITEIPAFATEDEERAWWDAHGRDVHLDAFESVQVQFDIRPRPRRSARLTLRLEPETIARYREVAAEMGMGYTSLMAEVLAQWQPKTRAKAQTRE